MTRYYFRWPWQAAKTLVPALMIIKTLQYGLLMTQEVGLEVAIEINKNFTCKIYLQAFKEFDKCMLLVSTRMGNGIQFKSWESSKVLSKKVTKWDQVH